VLVVVALGLGGLFIYQRSSGSNGPGDGKHDAPTARRDRPLERPGRPDGPLPALEVPADRRDTVRATRLEAEGDAAWQLNHMNEAMERSLDAWVLSPSAELALKLGEIHYQRDETAEAKAWWGRHLKETPSSRAAVYINSVLPHGD